MAVTGRQFNHIQELLDYLNGVVLSRDLSQTLDLDGLTLILTGGTTTFSGNGLTPNQIVAQINAAVSGAASLRNVGTASPPRSKLAFILAGQVIDKDGTANSFLGLSTTADVTVGATAVVKADIISITEFTNRFTVIHE